MEQSYQTMLLQILCACIATSYAYYQQSCAGKTLLRSGGLSCQDRQTILDAHNRARQNVAQGRVPGQPGASNMLEMVWDEQLAEIAQRWAEKCTIAHDKSRHVARFPVGQNIAVTWTTRKRVSQEPDFVSQVNGWFNEVRSYGFYSTGFSKGTGHYSQLVWGDTYLVGCGYSHYYDPTRGNTKLYVCNYGPAGNIVGSRPYQVGSPSCSAQGFSASSRYQGLCVMSGTSSLGPSCSHSSPYANYASNPTSYTSSNASSSSAATAYSTRPYTYSTRPYAYSTQSPYTWQTYSTTQYRQHYYG